MTKNNRKKALVQAISTAVALGWVIMQVESAQAATLTVNNLNDSGVGSLRDTINMATSNDVVEFLLGSNPSKITLTSGAIAIPAAGYAYAKNLTINGPSANLLTISGNHQFPVFDISAANVTLSGLAIAGNFDAHDFSNLTFTNSTISGDNFKIDINGRRLKLINTIISGNNTVNINTTDYIDLLLDGSKINKITTLGNTTNAGNLTISTKNLNIALSNVNGSNPDQISAGLAGNLALLTIGIILPPDAIISKPVPEPSVIAGIILAGSVAWLAQKKQAAFRKAKV
ncbi:MAG: PEP-CTERM sorting domain-containing protein [Nostoc sp.]|uniref:PEP-CTERM sorting domain-containing protein n=1 Tax=Nostoc sp. TaxID=1180 RepID=UPI002FFC360F